MKLTQPLFITFLLLFGVFQNSLFAQSDYNDRLYHLCKVWGYVKYFHSDISAFDCQTEWDDELIARIPEVKAANSDSVFNDILLQMLEEAGPMQIATTNPPNISDDLKINLELDWLTDPIFSSSVQTKLIEIKDNFRPHQICKILATHREGNAIFDADNAYWDDQGNYPDEPYRALAAFRYWNTIKYYFPYHYLMDQHWDVTLKQYVSKLVEAKGPFDYHLTFREFTAQIDDAHSFYNNQYYFSQIGGNNHTPFECHWIDNEMVVTKIVPGDNSGIEIGDIIKKWDGFDIYQLRDSIGRFIKGSNPASTNRDINRFIQLGQSGTFEIEIENKNGGKTLSITRNNSNGTTLSAQERYSYFKDTTSATGCKFRYINMGLLEQNQVGFMFANNTADATIFDVRNYPNGTLWSLVNYLYSSPVHVANFTYPNIEYPGVVGPSQGIIGQGTSNPYTGKVIILHNEDTQSQAEYTCMGLEVHPKSVKIGSQTAGADGNVTSVYLPGNIRAYFTNLGVYYPDGTETQRIGIVPDIELRPTIEDIRNGVDAVLNKAYEIGCSTVNSNEPNLSRFDVEISPNPFRDNILIKTINTHEAVKVFLTTPSGKVLKSEKRTGTFSLELNNIPTGMYFLTVISDERSLTKKVFKQ